jgi:hypothetical protein
MMRDIDVLNEEMMAAGARFFAGGLTAPRSARALRGATQWRSARHRRAIPRSQGAHRRFWILEAADMDEALAWGRKAVVACRAPVEVRAFFPMPA